MQQDKDLLEMVERINEQIESHNFCCSLETDGMNRCIKLKEFQDFGFEFVIFDEDLHFDEPLQALYENNGKNLINIIELQILRNIRSIFDKICGLECAFVNLAFKKIKLKHNCN